MQQARIQHRSAFMLLEAMIASVILAVAAVSIINLLLSTQEQQQSIQEINTATMLAQQLMEEIAGKPLGAYPPAVTTGARAQFSTANQYDQYTDSTSASSGIKMISGATVPFPSMGTYTRSVSIIDAATAQANPHDIRIVTVTVTTPSLTHVSLSKWLANVVLGES